MKKTPRRTNPRGAIQYLQHKLCVIQHGDVVVDQDIQRLGLVVDLFFPVQGLSEPVLVVGKERHDALLIGRAGVAAVGAEQELPAVIADQRAEHAGGGAGELDQLDRAVAEQVVGLADRSEAGVCESKGLEVQAPAPARLCCTRCVRRRSAGAHRWRGRNGGGKERDT